MTEEHGALLESLEAAEAARADLEATISSMKVQAARDRRERRCEDPYTLHPKSRTWQLP